MAVQTRCPFCGADNVRTDESKKVTCKKCHYTFSVAVAPPKQKAKDKPGPRKLEVAEEGIQERPGKSAPRRRYEEDEPPLRRKKAPVTERRSRNSALPWIVGGALVGLFLFVSLGGLVVWLLLDKKPASTGAAVALQQASAGADKAMAPVVQDAPIEPPPPGQPVVLQPPQPPQAGANPGEGGLPADTLQVIKNATVFIKVPQGGGMGFGSGFLMSGHGDTGYVVTNHHVVTAKVQQLPGFGLGGFPGPPMFPGFPDPFPMIAAGEAQVPRVTLVFFSGTAQEMSVQGDVVAAVKEPDLALVKISQVKNLPKALDCTQTPQLVETMPVFLVGFPLGPLLAEKPGNPEITIGKGSISSLRRNAKGELTLVQIDGDVNPGNSGGPVVNAQGRLVGITFAKIRDTKIGLAVPPEQLSRLLVSRVAGANIGRRINHPEGGLDFAGEDWIYDAEGATKTQSPFFSRTQNGDANARLVDRGKAEVVLKAAVHDPLQQVQSVWAYYLKQAPGQQFQMIGPEGRWLPMPGAGVLELKQQNGQYAGSFVVPAEEKGPVYYFQFSYRNKENQLSYTQPGMFNLHREAPKVAPVVAGAPQAPPEPKKPLSKDQLAKSLEELQSSDRWAVLRGLQSLQKAEPTKEKRAEVEKAIQPLLNDRDTFIQGDAIKAIGIWGSKDSVPALIKLLKHHWVFTRQAVYEVLATFKDERSVEPIAEGLKNFHERGQASKALKALGPMAEKAVLSYLNTDDVFLRPEVCHILAEIGTKASIPGLEEAARAQHPWTIEAAKKALTRIAERTKAAADKPKK